MTGGKSYNQVDLNPLTFKLTEIFVRTCRNWRAALAGTMLHHVIYITLMRFHLCADSLSPSPVIGRKSLLTHAKTDISSDYRYRWKQWLLLARHIFTGRFWSRTSGFYCQNRLVFSQVVNQTVLKLLLTRKGGYRWIQRTRPFFYLIEISGDFICLGQDKQPLRRFSHHPWESLSIRICAILIFFSAWFIQSNSKNGVKVVNRSLVIAYASERGGT